MPVQYKDSPKAQSIIESTKHCREKAGLFDVSHMCSIRWRGKVINAMKTIQLVDIGAVATDISFSKQ
jgi:glycine cleavage system aminomethyltransferase T